MNFGKTQQNVIRQAYVRTDGHGKNSVNISHRSRQRKLPQKVEWRRRVRREGEDRWAWWPIGWSQGGVQQELQEAPNVGTSDTAAERTVRETRRRGGDRSGRVGWCCVHTMTFYRAINLSDKCR